MSKPIGKWGYHAGVAATVTLNGEIVTRIMAIAPAGGTIAIAGGDTITIPAAATGWFNFEISGDGLSTGAIVFTGTAAYVVETIKPGG